MRCSADVRCPSYQLKADALFYLSLGSYPVLVLLQFKVALFCCYLFDMENKQLILTYLRKNLRKVQLFLFVGIAFFLFFLYLIPAIIAHHSQAGLLPIKLFVYCLVLPFVFYSYVYRYLKLVGLIDNILVELDCERTICTGKLFSLKSIRVEEIGESKELYILDSKYSCNVYVEVGS